MATGTANWSLVKPLASEKANISVINSNMDKLDGLIGKIQEWTPQLYDNNTYVRDLATGSYLQIGQFVFAWFSRNNPDFSGISTMLQIRNIPISYIFGGSMYIAALNQTSHDNSISIQGGGENLLPRPNIVSSDFSNPASPGTFSFAIFGIASPVV